MRYLASTEAVIASAQRPRGESVGRRSGLVRSGVLATWVARGGRLLTTGDGDVLSGHGGRGAPIPARGR